MDELEDAGGGLPRHRGEKKMTFVTPSSRHLILTTAAPSTENV